MSRPQGKASAPGNGGWDLNSQALSLLLEKLDRDPDVAAREYERIHERLVRYFEWRGCRPPAQLADEVLDRLAHKLEKGQTVDFSDTQPVTYLLGIAHNVAKEVYRSYKLKGREVDAVEDLVAPEEKELDNGRLQQLDDCLSRLAAPDRELLLGYYQGERRTKIDNRNQIAKELGLSVNALRVRAHRLRQKIERCMRGAG